MTILNESGTPDVLSPLYGLHALAGRLPDALLVVAGTCADIHLAQSLSVPLPGAPADPQGQNDHNGDSLGVHPRVVFILLDPDEEPSGGALASRVIEVAAGFRHTDLVLLVACRSAALLGFDASFEAELAERRLGLPVRALLPDLVTGGVLSTNLEDAAVRVLLDLSPSNVPEPEEAQPYYSKGGLLGRLPLRSRPGRRTGETGVRRPVVLLGALPSSRRELAREFARVGVEVAGGLPSAQDEWLPDIGEGTVVAAMDPYLTRACGTTEERGANLARSLFPIGVDGTARFIQDVSALAGLTTSEAGRARQVWKGLDPLRNRIRGKRVFFTGDTGLEVPLARFLADAGAVVLEVGTPRLDRHSLGAELSTLGEDVDVVESPDWRAQLARVDATRPDVVVASPGLYVPLVARGYLCRSSLELLSLGVHGYEGARRVLELFARTFEGAEKLDALNL
ncbi:MAG: Light-independent protochlorophyllide reductase subunit N [uncultured Rubrobacteraceae bacterium]|uniref:Light-independent protochlorophyllide reductase subunit N n=1 Tax=uncultured Rubrobacteraceae bacterium TaxID=349277 RepID=A0A6J4R652_9ACTN|nr:MAG: Light-independent protochlorophyllide reductase subunit N [uncultured Rubrobacteraceae bacterium]